MLQYQKIDVSEVIDVNKASASKESDLCHYWFFKDVEFKFEEQHFCNGCREFLTMGHPLENIAILSAKGTTFRSILMLPSKKEALKKIK